MAGPPTRILPGVATEVTTTEPTGVNALAVIGIPISVLDSGATVGVTITGVVPHNDKNTGVSETTAVHTSPQMNWIGLYLPTIQMGKRPLF